MPSLNGWKAAPAGTPREMAGPQEISRTLRKEEPARSKRHAMAARAPEITRRSACHQETANDYIGIVARLCDRYRVIVCKDRIQWILQRRDGERHGRSRWAGVGYFRTREALLRASRALCGRIDPTALAALALLPEHFGRAGG